MRYSRGPDGAWEPAHKVVLLCRPIPGNHGSLTLFFARVTDIAVGVCVVLLFDLIMPWYGLTPLPASGSLMRESYVM